MSASRDADRLIHAFLLEGEERLSDQVYDAVRAGIDHKRQRVVIGPWRMPTMNKFVPIGLGIAAVLAVLLLGSRLLASPTGTVGGPGVEPTSTPEASVAQPSSAAGGHPQGSYLFWAGDGNDTRITTTIPGPGWYGGTGGGILVKNDNADPPDGAGMIGPYYRNLLVPSDPCKWLTPDTSATTVTTVDDLVAALESQASRDASVPVDITMDGYAGKSITIHVPDDADFSTCDLGQFCTLMEDNRADCDRYHQGPGQIDEVRILDVDGEVNVFFAAYYEGTPAEHVAEMHAILDSMDFE